MVLNDHIKRGKKLLPRILASSTPMHSISWQIERFPQYILLALYLEDNPLVDAVDTFFQMNVSYASIMKDYQGERIFRPTLMREHLILNEYEKQAIEERSERAAWRCRVAPYLNTISSLLAANPMDYLLKKKNKICKSQREANIKKLKCLLGKTIDRRSKSSLYIQAVAVSVELRSGYTKMNKGIEIPDLNAVVDYPSTEESKDAAGFIVTQAMLMATGMNIGQIDMTWQRQFWDGCYRLESCEFNYE